MAASGLFLLLATISIAYAHPNFECSRYCKETPKSFGYERGRTYTYSYSGIIKSLVNSTVTEESGVQIKSYVDIGVLSRCDFYMKLRDVTLEDFHVENSVENRGEISREMSDKLEKDLLHFSFQNGKIDNLCVDADEDKETLDVKRGILSVFQNGMQSLTKNTVLYETDITGTCQTRYESEAKHDFTVVKKIKNLDACTHRKSQYLSWQSVPYKSAKSLPLLKSSLNCVQKYKNNVLHSAVCNEKHVFQPFSHGDNGAVTAVEQEMNFLTETKSIERVQPRNIVRKTLNYEENEKKLNKVQTGHILKLFKKLEMKSLDGIENGVPALFSELVFSFKTLEKSELINIFNVISLKQRKFYIDAIALLTTTSGIEAMRELHKNKLIDSKQMNAWLVSLSFIKDPTAEIINAIEHLMILPETKQKAVLTISSLINKFCKKNSNCLKDEAVLSAIKIIESPLRRPTMENIDDILLALKAIGNAGVITSFNFLRNYYTNEDVKIEMRLSAIAAHRRFSCSQNVNLDDFRNRFAMLKENTEIRIASYLALMQCASYADFALVKDILVKEETNQVGSFVWTHLTNLQETSSPWKQSARLLLENDFLKNKFNTDLRKYSRNYEASAFFDSVGTGGSIESNVIFTSESYLPRSAMLNFTLDLFGETVNVFEIGGRLEGFEEIVENFFGPNGYFADDSIKAFLENAKKAHNGANEKIKGLGDEFRARTLEKEPAGLLYAKIFGNEISYKHFGSMEDLVGDAIPVNKLMEVLMNIFRENDVDYTRSVMFLDASYKVPTMFGFPLELSTNGTATVGLTVKGNVDLKDLWSYKIGLRGKIYPSIALDVVGTMSIETSFTKIGVKYVGTMNSNTYIDGHAFIESGKIVDLKLNVPKSEVDIINVSSDIYVFRNSKTFKIQEASRTIEESTSCTQEVFSKVTGFKVCSHYKFVNASQEDTAPHFPLTGGFKYALKIKKTDHFDSYQLQLNTTIEEQARQPLYSMLLYLNTPNSAIDRKIVASYHLDCEKLSLSAKFLSPFVSFEIYSKLGSDFNKYSFQLQTLYNSKEIISLLSTFKINNVGKSLNYEPSAKLNYYRKQVAAVSGSVNYVTGSKYRADLRIEGITKYPILVRGDLTYDKDKFDIKSEMTSSTLGGKLHATAQRNADGLSITTASTYKYNTGKEESLNIILNFNKLRRGALYKDSIKFLFESSQKPIYNMLLQLRNERSNWYFENNGSLTFFGTTWNSNQLFKFQNDNHPDIAIKADLICKEKDINYKIGLVYNVTSSAINAHALIQLTQEQRLEALLTYLNTNNQTNFKTLLYYPKNQFELNTLIKGKNGSHKFDIDAQLDIEGDKIQLFTIEGDYTNATYKDVSDYNVNCTLTFANYRWRTPWIVTSNLQKSPSMFLSFVQLKTNENIFISHMNWVQSKFSIMIQADDKRILVINGEQNGDTISTLLALNIYQHFELGAKLVLPFDKFQVVFYWDKDRDQTRKLSLGVEKDYYKGYYNMDLEYPTQKIAATFVLLPTQVTLNVTWGIKRFQKIYLKMGNIIYDVGGVWFGELETPFKYLERQEFKLKYYVVSDSFEVQCDVLWRAHSVNFLVSGTQSVEKMSGYVQLNTTFAEIAKIEAAIAHTHKTMYNCKTDGYFVYNKDSVKAHSDWAMTHSNAKSNFLIESPTGLLDPIGGHLSIHNDASRKIDFNLTWKDKFIKWLYMLEKNSSSVLILTPFEGFKKTHLQYSIGASAQNVFFNATLNLLEQNNTFALNWINLHDQIVLWMKLDSSIIDKNYELHLEHDNSSVIKEIFWIKSRNDDVVNFDLVYDVRSFTDLHLNVSLNFLNQTVALNAHNSIYILGKPLFSSVAFTWNDLYVTSVFTSNNTQYTLLILHNNNEINFKLFKMDDAYTMKLNVFGKFSATNILVLKEHYAENTFILNKSTKTLASLIYNHKSSSGFFVQNLDVFVNSHTLKTRLDIENEARGYNFKIELLNLTERTLSVTSKGKFDVLNSSIDMDIKNIQNPFGLLAKYDFRNQNKTAKISMNMQNFTWEIVTEAFQNNTKGSYLVKSVAPENYPYFTGKFGAEYNARTFNFTLNFPNKNYRINANLLKSDVLKAEASLVRNGVKLIGIELDLIDSAGLLNYEQNFDVVKNIKCNYKIIKSGNEWRLITKSVSNFTSIANFSSIFIYGEERGDGLSWNNLVLVKLGEYKFESSHRYNMNNSEDEFAARLTSDLVIEVFNTNLTLKLAGDVKNTAQNGAIHLGYTSNFEKFKDLDFSVNYTVDATSYELAVFCVQDDQIYQANFSQLMLPDSYEISTEIYTPKFGLFKVEINTLKVNREYTTQIFLSLNERFYNADIITTFVSWTDINSSFQINLEEKYAGYAEIKFNETGKYFDTNIAFPEDVMNKFKFSLEPNFAFMKLQLDSFEIHQLISLKYKLGTIKEVNLEYFNAVDAKYTVHTLIHHNVINMTLSTPTELYIVHGRHKLISFKDFDLNYSLVKNNDEICKLNVLNYFGEYYQTKFDFIPKLRNWGRFTVENKIDSEKIRIAVVNRAHHISLVAKRLTTKEETSILSIDYQDENVLELLAGKGQITLVTSSRLGKYRLYVQCTQNPGIFVFSVLKEGENLISLVLQNLSNDNFLEVKGKLNAPDLIPDHPNLNMQLISHYDVLKSMRFQINDSVVPLFEMTWYTKHKPGDYSGYLKFDTIFEDIESFEITSYFNTISGLAISTATVFNNDRFEFDVLLSDEHKFNVLYPCEDKTCGINFHLKNKSIDFSLYTPYKTYERLILSSFLKLEGTTASGKLQLIKNEQIFDSKCMYGILNESAFIETKLNFTLYNELITNSLELQYNYYNDIIGKLKLADVAINLNLTKTNGKFTFGETHLIATYVFKESDETEIKITSENTELFLYSRSRISNNDQTQRFIFKRNILGYFLIDLYYDISSPDDVSLGILIDSRLNFAQPKVYNITLNCLSNYSRGVIKIDTLNDRNTVTWMYALESPSVLVTLNWNRNNDESQLKISHVRNENTLNTSFAISSDQGKLDLIVRGEIVDARQLRGVFELRTPLESLKEIKAQTVLHHAPNRYHLRHSLLWPKQHLQLELGAEFGNVYKLDMSLDSSFTSPVNSSVEFTKNNSGISFNFTSAAGQDYLKLGTNITPLKSIRASLESSFVNFKSCKFTGYKTGNTLNLDFIKDELEIQGVLVKNQLAHEGVLHVIYPDGSTDKLTTYLKFDNTKFNASFQFKNHALHMKIALDNNNYKIDLKSPYKYAKEVQLSGMYTNEVDIYNIETGGHWNDLSVKLSGVLKLDPAHLNMNFGGNIGNEYKGELNFTHLKEKGKRVIELTAYFPDKTSNTYIKFEKQKNTANVILKTPFENFSTLLVNTTFKKFERIDVSVMGDILKRKFNIFNTGTMSTSEVEVTLHFDREDIDHQWDVILKADPNYGRLNIYERTLEDEPYNTTLEYILEGDKFSANYHYTNGVLNETHHLSLFYENGPDITYGIVLDDYKFLERIFINDLLNTQFIASIPCFDIRDFRIYITKNLVNGSFENKIFFNEHSSRIQLEMTNGQFDWKNCSARIDYEIKCFESSIHGEVTLDSVRDTLQIEHNAFDGDGELLLASNFVNNVNLLQLKFALGPDDYEIYISKNLDRIKFDLLVRLYIENGINPKFLFSCRNNFISVDLSENVGIKVYSDIFDKNIKIELIRNISNQLNYNYYENELLLYNAALKLDSQIIFLELNGVDEKLIELEILYGHFTYIKLNYFGVVSSAEIFFKTEPYSARLLLESPLLKNSRYNIELTIWDIKNLIVAIESGAHKVYVDTRIKEKLINVTLQAPFLDEFHFEILWDFSNGIDFHKSILLFSKYLGDVNVKTDFVLHVDVLHIETDLNVPFFEGFEHFKAKIYLPKEFRPEIKLVLPNNVIYSLHFKHNFTKDHMLLDTGYRCGEKASSASFDLVPSEGLKTELLLSNLYVSFNGRHKNLELLVNNFNYSLNYDYSFNSTKMLLIDFKAPNVIYSVDFKYSFEENKVFKALIFYPGLKHKIGIVMGFNPNLKSLTFIYHIFLPIAIKQFDFATFHVISKISDSEAYKLDFGLSTNNYSMILKAGLNNKIDVKVFRLEAAINEKRVFGQFQFVGKNISNSDLHIDFETPLQSFRTTKISLKALTEYKQYKHKNTFFMVINNNSVINSTFDLNKDTLVVLNENKWRPFALNYKSNSTNLLANICWDLNNKEASQLGTHVSLHKEILVAAFLPNNTFKTIIDLNHKYLELNWNQIELALKYNPSNMYFRSSDKVLGFKYNATDFKVTWGGNTSFVSLKFINTGITLYSLTTPGLKHPLMLSFMNDDESCKINLKYTDDPTKLITFRTIYTYSNENIYRKYLLVHPASKIDYELTYNIHKSREYSKVNVTLRSRNFQNQLYESLKAGVRVNHEKFGVLSSLETEKNKMSLELASLSDKEKYGYAVEAKVNENDPVHLEFNYNYKQISPSIDFVLSSGEGIRYIVYAGLPSDKEITAKVEHEIYGKYSLDALATMRLNTTQLLWIKIYWKNKMFTQFYQSVADEYADLRYVFNTAATELIETLHDDIGKELAFDLNGIKNQIWVYGLDEKRKLASGFFENDVNCNENYICEIFIKHPVIKDFFENISKPLNDAINSVTEIIQVLYKDVKEVVTLVNFKHYIDSTFEHIENVKNIKINGKDIVRTMIKDARRSFKKMETAAIRLLDEFDRHIDIVKMQIETFFEPILNLLDDFVAYMEQRLVIIQIGLLDAMDTVQRYIYNLREIKEMLQVYSSYLNWLEELHVTDLLEPIGDIIEDFLERIVTDMKKVIEDYKPYLDALSQALFGKYDGLTQLPPVTEFRNFVNKIYQKTIWIWHYHNMTENVKSCIHKLSSDIDDVLGFIEFDDKNDFENTFEQTGYVFRPEMGLIEISQPLPVEMDGFLKAPRYEQHPLYQKIKRKYDNFVKLYRNRYDLIDGLQSFFADLSEPAIAPATFNFAMVVGNSHFLTFNNAYYQFLSNCSYLLASDFKTNSFSLIIHFDNSTGVVTRTFEILNDGISIELTPNSTVRLNKKIVEYPLHHNTITVTRNYEGVSVESLHGFKVKCNWYYDYCSIQLSGWLYGRTGGLLGTLNNENNDNVMSNGVKTSDVDEFAKSWKLDDTTCSNFGMKSPQLDFDSFVSNHICNVFFNDNVSPVSQCFHSVDPLPYEEICKRDLRTKSKFSICSSLAAYRTKCHKSGINLAMPEICVQCEHGIHSTEAIYDGHNPKSLDIVFITQLDCLNNTIDARLSNGLNQYLGTIGYHDNRFAAVGYGGNTLTRPHVYTSDNKTWTTSDKLNIKTNYEKTLRNNHRFSGIDAIKYAFHLDFRPGVPKHFVLAQCEVLNEFEDAPKMYNMMADKDVTLHVLKRKPFGNFSDKIIGLNEGNFVVSIYGGLARSTSNAQIIDGMTDVYSGLALSTNGSVFDVESVERSMQSWVELVAKSVHPSPCQMCKCVPDFEGVGKIECSCCLSPAVKNFLNVYEAENKMQFGGGSNDGEGGGSSELGIELDDI